MNEWDKTRNDFWLDLGPAAEWAGMPPEQAARAGGDASPDGRLRGFAGAVQGTVYQPGSQPGRLPDRHEDAAGQHPDVDGGSTPPELTPAPPETWPGL